MFLKIFYINRKYNPTINADYFWRAGIIRDFLLHTYTVSVYNNFFIVNKCIALILFFFNFGRAAQLAGS